MIKEWFNWINLSVAGLAILLLLLAVYIRIGRATATSLLDAPVVKTSIVVPAYEQPKEAYNKIEDTLLSLKTVPIAMQLPDLRTALTYFGKNNRPDADPNNAMMYFGFQGDKVPMVIVPGEKVYIAYDRKAVPPRYLFSPDNAQTHLWIEVAMEGSQPTVNVRMSGEEAQIITEPAANAKFSPAEKPPQQIGGANAWEIGKWRVDGTLLARQRARWYGVDLFLEKHGGPEFEWARGKQRIDFGEGEEAYTVFVDKNSVLVWTGDRWKVVEPGIETLGRPILVAKKIDEKVMNFEIWDPDGKSRVSLNLLKTTEPAITPNLISTFKFIGAKTLSQFVFEVNKERMTLTLQDWILNVDKGWKKLTTPEEIDDYVERKTPGYLLTIDGLDRRDDRQVLIGTLYNKARTDSQPVELLMQQAPSGLSAPLSSKKEGGKPEDEDGEHDDDHELDETINTDKNNRLKQ